jgi:hypothetical protein
VLQQVIANPKDEGSAARKQQGEEQES